MASFSGATLSHPAFVDSPLVEALHERPCEQLSHEFREKVARWCPLVAQHFDEDLVHYALHVIECESGGDPSAKNRHSTASGLSQFLEKAWERERRFTGAPAFRVARFDPEWNVIQFASYFERGGPSRWSCKAPHALP